MKIDIVVPCYNDLLSLQELVKQVDIVFNDCNYDLNFIVIDNASYKPIFLELDIKKSMSRRLFIHRLAVNVGYEAAILYGIKQSRGDICAVIDSDLEDPPSVLKEMIGVLISSGADCVYGVRLKRETTLRLKLLYSLFYKLYSFISDNVVQSNAGEFAVYNRKTVERISLYKSNDCFVRGIRTLVGGYHFPYGYSRARRFIGESKFRFYSSFDLALSGFLFNTKKPLRFFTLFGLTAYLFSGLIISFNLIVKIINQLLGGSYQYVLPEGLTQTSVIIYFLLLSIFTLLVIIGEYVLIVNANTNGRPVCFVESIDEL